MKLINIFDYLTKTDGGGNYVNSGASFNINTGEFNPPIGYFVALGGYEKRYPLPLNPNQWRDISLDFLQANVWDVIGGRDDIYIGFWIHEGLLYIDLSERIENRDQAIREGFTRQQIAIYDAEAGKDIYLNRVSNDSDLTF
jgi:hypothetical protein